MVICRGDTLTVVDAALKQTTELQILTDTKKDTQAEKYKQTYRVCHVLRKRDDIFELILTFLETTVTVV